MYVTHGALDFCIYQIKLYQIKACLYTCQDIEIVGIGKQIFFTFNSSSVTAELVYIAFTAHKKFC